MHGSTTELTVDDLLDAVAKLDETELAEFEVRFEQLWLSRQPVPDAEAAHIADEHRLPPRQQARVRELLDKNREEGLTDDEERELDLYMTRMDEALEQTTDELLKLAERRRQQS
jgi:hypothetical protein